MSLARIQARRKSLAEQRKQIDNELRRLEIAEDVLLSLPDENGRPAKRAQRGSTKPSIVADFSSARILDVAATILRDGPMHFRDIAKRGWDGGYRGKEGTTLEKTETSFSKTMKRHDGIFEVLGRPGEFQLTESAKIELGIAETPDGANDEKRKFKWED